MQLHWRQTVVDFGFTNPPTRSHFLSIPTSSTTRASPLRTKQIIPRSVLTLHHRLQDRFSAKKPDSLNVISIVATHQQPSPHRQCSPLTLETTLVTPHHHHLLGQRDQENQNDQQQHHDHHAHSDRQTRQRVDRLAHGDDARVGDICASV